MFAVLVVTGTAALSVTRILERVDLVLYDALLPLQATEFSDDIVVVAIDDVSLSRLGRWPWSRRLHARLMDRLAELGARVVAFDVLFSEPQRDDPQADPAFAEAMARYGRAVLAVAPIQEMPSRPISELLPVPGLAATAAALGHVDIELDQDGLCRSFYLYAGLDDARWPVLALAMLKAGGELGLPRKAAGPRNTIGGRGGWLRIQRLLIPFGDRGAAHQRVSVYDVLNGQVLAEVIRDKYVLVGATATGLGDAISTPGSRPHKLTRGVELNAQIFNGLLQNTVIRELSRSWNILLSVSFVIATIVMLVLVPVRIGIGLIVAGMISVLMLSAVLLAGWRVWFPPAAALTMLVLALPLWSVWSLGVEYRLRQKLSGRIDYMAHHHPATGLPNQAALEARLRELNSSGEKVPVCIGLMIIHIDWPTSAGSMLGKTVSESALQGLTDRLRMAVGTDELVAHLNGDDFAVLISGQPDSEAIQRAGNELLESLRKLSARDDDGLCLAPHSGASVWPTDSTEPGTLVRNAYTALLKSRLDDSHEVRMYSEEIGREIEARSRLEQALVHALERGEFEMHYQPQVNADDGRIVGVEALLRWHSPQLGDVGPAAFIPVAEDVGLIDAIGDWVLETASRQVKAWNDAGLGPLRLAVNLSPLQFSAPGLVDRIRAVIDRVGIAPRDLDLEITESTIMRDMDGAVRAMRALKAQGVALAIDDFGTGHSSLARLQHFPLDRIKIDHSFINEIGNNDNAAEIALAIISMAKRVGLQVIAEGVETTGQDEFFRRHSCDELQGYLYSHPLPASELESMLRERTITPVKSDDDKRSLRPRKQA
jgi:diguanylate cyclase (GGDEF)-like protein